jgi:uncharacterized phage infection (PIP) family protein YhgE
MNHLRALRGSLLLAAWLTATLGMPLATEAIETQESSQQIQELVAEARELLQAITVQIRDVDAAMQRAMAQSGDTTRMFASGYEYRELKRSASDLSEVANKIVSLASRCGEDGKKVTQSFKSSVRRLNTDVNRMASSSATTLARMSIEDLNRDVEAITRDLQPVVSVPDCSPGSDDEEPAGEEQTKSG